jgi:hypothetical protein
LPDHERRFIHPAQVGCGQISRWLAKAGIQAGSSERTLKEVPISSSDGRAVESAGIAPARRHIASSPSLQRTALELCAGVIARPPPAVAEIPDRETLITKRWLHHELHDAIPALPVHVVATY